MLILKGVIYYIRKGFLVASFLVQLRPDFGYSSFLHHIEVEKRVPAKSKFYGVPKNVLKMPVPWIYYTHR